MPNKRAAYFAALYRKKKAADPEFMKKNAEKAREWNRNNPEYSRRKNAERRARDPEAARKANREWFAKNPDKRVFYEQRRRARKLRAEGQVSPDIREKLMILQRGRCAYCMIALSRSNTALDHVVPLTKGGAHDDANLQLLCRLCNNRKYNKDPIEFMQSLGKLL